MYVRTGFLLSGGATLVGWRNVWQAEAPPASFAAEAALLANLLANWYRASCQSAASDAGTQVPTAGAVGALVEVAAALALRTATVVGMPRLGARPSVSIPGSSKVTLLADVGRPLGSVCHGIIVVSASLLLMPWRLLLGDTIAQASV